MRTLPIALVCLCLMLIAEPVAAQIIKAEYNATITINNPPVTPAAAISAFLSAEAAQATGAQTYQVQYAIPIVQNGNSTLNANFALSIPSNFQAAGIDFVNNGFSVSLPAPSIQPPTIAVHEELLHVAGSASLYSFGIGALSVSQEINGQYCLIDRIRINSPVATSLALPVRLMSTAAAAESFGTPALTFGRIEAAFSGTVNQQAITGGTLSVESESVFPINGEIDSSERIRFDLVPGVNFFDVSIRGRFSVRADAYPAGLGGSISGASTADIQFPRFAINQFEMWDLMQPSLLPWMTILSDTYGVSYLPTPLPEPPGLILIGVTLLVSLRGGRRIRRFQTSR